MPDYLKLAQEAYDASTAYIDGNWRKDWDYSLKAFRNEHASGSKYLSDEYKHRSRLFRPRTRTIIRKNEAAGMQAMFNNRETVQVEPGNPDDLMSVASAACMKEVLEYRLTKTIPAYEIYLGGLQDAQTMGNVCSYQYWEYEKKGDRKVKDQPCIELRPMENIRLDAGASWLDPVNTSPYFCDIIPMYVCDVRSMMTNKDDKTNAPKWKKFDDATIAKATPDVMDSTRIARIGKHQDPIEERPSIMSFDIVWVMRWFMRESGDDMVYYTLGTENLLTDPVPIEEVYFHGKRPYVLGYAVLETHKVIKSGFPVLTRPLQQESNEVANQRMDNVKFVLNKRWLVARGRQVDVNSLVRNVPGGVTLVTDPKNDVQESNWPDVTSSAFVEQDRLNSDFDELAGNFSPSTKVANNAVNDTLGGSKMASAGAGLMTEYMLRTVNETWWEKVIRQLVMLEQYYETDDVVLALCAQKAQLFPRFGMSQITDDMLMKEVNITIDASMGNPNERLQRFLMATNAAMQIRMNPAPGANVAEMTKEIYANAGYREGSRFFSDKQDPALMKAMQMIQQLQGQVQGKQMELQAGLQETQLKLQSNEKIKGAELQVDTGRIQGDLQIRQSELMIEQQRLELERMKIAALQEGAQTDVQLKIADMQRSIDESAQKLENERQKLEREAQMEQDRLSVQVTMEREKLDSKEAMDHRQAVADVHRAIAEHRIKIEGMIAVQDAKHEHEKEIGYSQMEHDKKMGEATEKTRKSEELVGEKDKFHASMKEMIARLEKLSGPKTITLIKEGDKTVGAQVA